MLTIPFKRRTFQRGIRIFISSREYRSCVRSIDCKIKFDFLFFGGRHYVEVAKTVQTTESMTVIPARFAMRRSAHTLRQMTRFSDTAAVLDPQVGLTHSADVICTIFFLRATSFYSFHSVPFDCQCNLVFI